MSVVFYQCPHCGNIIVKAVDSGVPVMCCGAPMKEMEPNSSGASAEKHLPVAEREGAQIIVKVGAITHPMTEEHLISLICLETNKGFRLVSLSPDDDPGCSFALGTDEEALAVYEYCNLHGLWKTTL